MSRSVAGTMTTYDWVLRGMKKFPSFVAVLLLSLSISTCGGLSLALGLIFYFFKVINSILFFYSKTNVFTFS